MADLNDLQAAGVTKLVGSDSAGLETNAVNADANGNLQTINPSEGPVTPGAVALKSALIGGQFNTALPTLTNTQQAALQLDSNGRIILAPLTNSSIVKAQLQDNAGTAITLGQKVMASSLPVVIASDQSAIPAKLQDGSGNAISSSSGELDVRDTIQVGGVFAAQSVTTSAAEAKVGASRLTNRKLLVVTPTNGTVYWGLTSSVTVSNGTPIFKNQAVTFAFEIAVFLIAASTVDCRIVEVN